MREGLLRRNKGYTIIELMVTIVIVSVLAATVGTLVVNLLTIQERDREEAYLQEKLTDICTTFADYLSLGTNVVSSEDLSCFDVVYRDETCGVSFETGRVSHVSRLSTSVNPRGNDYTATDIDLRAHVFERGVLNPDKFARTLRGEDTPLVPLEAMKELTVESDNKIRLSYLLAPFSTEGLNEALWYLRVMAQYTVTYDNGRRENKTLASERIVRLWNQK